jgi:hypothetical protein
MDTEDQNVVDLNLILLQIANYQYFLKHWPKAGAFFVYLWTIIFPLAYLCGFHAFALIRGNVRIPV